MDENKCANCDKIIYKLPCPYCGNEKSYIEGSTFENMGISVSIDAVLIKGNSEVTIEKDNKIVAHKKYKDVSNVFIADDSLAEFNSKTVTPQYIRDQIVYNISKIEQYSNENPPEKVIHEHSFELNLKIFKYIYKKIIEKNKKD